MMEMLCGNPFFLVATTGVCTAILIFMYFQTHDIRLRPFIIVAVLLTLLPVLTDYLITTDRESIRTTVKRLANAVQMNDINRAAAFAHPDSMVHKKIRQEMPNYDFDFCNVAGFNLIDINEEANEAKVKFTVFVSVDAKRGPEGVGNRGITLNMRQDGQGKWRIMDYQHYPPMKRAKESTVDRY